MGLRTAAGNGRHQAEGSSLFSVESKRQAVSQILSGEKTLVELSRDLEVQPAVLRTWMHLVERGGATAVAAGEEVVPASRGRERAQQSIGSHRRFDPYSHSIVAGGLEVTS
jgi:transposase-like protein